MSILGGALLTQGPGIIVGCVLSLVTLLIFPSGGIAALIGASCLFFLAFGVIGSVYEQKLYAKSSGPSYKKSSDPPP